ncbi:MAG: methyltransferase domain-containing protein [Ardenticatenaceae bacterium]|nr:methyltransferase domain-containing protein [Ardenticatenaceae bacterium]
MSENSDHYEDKFIAFLEVMWGDGYLSPGGAAEIRRLLEGIDLVGKEVLDIGCGSGGITVLLATEFGAARVIGVDVEEPVCRHARETAVRAGAADRVDIRQISPDEPIPLPDGSLDIVFSKDSIVHIPDKETLAQQAFRLLKPGGWFVASDWLISHDGPPSPEMADYIRREDLDFGMASPRRYQKALAAAGFVNIHLNNRNPWYLAKAKGELARMQGPERPQFDATLGHEGIEEQIELWQAMLVVLATGEHCPHHFRAQKPGNS